MACYYNGSHCDKVVGCGNDLVNEPCFVCGWSFKNSVKRKPGVREQLLFIAGGGRVSCRKQAQGVKRTTSLVVSHINMMSNP